MTPLPEKMALGLQLPPHLNTGVRTKLPSGLCVPGEAWHVGSLRLRGGSYRKPAPLPLALHDGPTSQRLPGSSGHITAPLVSQFLPL